MGNYYFCTYCNASGGDEDIVQMGMYRHPKYTHECTDPNYIRPEDSEDEEMEI